MNETCETCEIWWDSSPLVFDSWSKSVIEETPDDKKDMVREWHERYYISDKPLEQLFRGVTTNPPLSWAAVKDAPAFWREWAIEQKRKDPSASAHDIWWRMYREIVKRGAETYLGVFNRSGFEYGYLSGHAGSGERSYPQTSSCGSCLLQRSADVAETRASRLAVLPHLETCLDGGFGVSQPQQSILYRALQLHVALCQAGQFAEAAGGQV